jgi:hypothetical protein
MKNEYIAAYSILYLKKTAALKYFAKVCPADYSIGRHKII